MTNAKVCGNCWHSSPSGICRKHGAPITPNSTCDSYEKDPYVYDVFIDVDQYGNGSGRIVRRWNKPEIQYTVGSSSIKDHSFIPTPTTNTHKPTDGPRPDPKPAQCSGESCDHPGCPRANNGEFDHSGYYRYVPQQPGTDCTNDEGDSDVQLEEVVNDLSDRLDIVDSDTNSRIDFYRNRTYKLEDRADVNDSWAESLLPVLVIAYVAMEVAKLFDEATVAVVGLVVMFCLFGYWVVFNALRKDARDK